MLPHLKKSLLSNFLILIVGWLSLSNNFLIAQENLIINGDCEQYGNCPGNNDNIVDAYGWWSFDSIGSPDYLNTCSVNNSTKIPHDLGFQYPFSENGMIHSALFPVLPLKNFSVFDIDQRQLREAFGGSLKEALQPGIYEFSMYVNYANFGKGDGPIGYYDGRVATNAFDVMLLEDSTTVTIATAPYIDPTKAFPLNGETIINDTLNWVKLTGCVQAKGGERFFAIGSLRDTSQMKLEFSGYHNVYYISSYYFDDFSLVACPTCCAGQFEVEEGVSVSYGEAQVSFAPFILAGSYADLKIYDSAGRWVASHRFESDSGPFVLQHLAQGMYHYVFESQIGTLKTGKVTSF